jgi:hypothetical protein
LALGFWGGLGEESGVLLRGNSKLVEEGMMPDSFHVLPVVNDTVLDGVFKVQDTSLGLSLITDVGFLFVHADHYSGHLRSADDGRETASRSIISSDTGLALILSVIDNNCSLIFSHVS